MSKLIGTDPNQVPSNADLGTLAYVDSENAGEITLSYLTTKSYTGTPTKIEISPSGVDARIIATNGDGGVGKIHWDQGGGGRWEFRSGGVDANTGLSTGSTTRLDIYYDGQIVMRNDAELRFGGYDGTLVIDSKGLVQTDNRPSYQPSLMMDFANSKTIDPRITFTRSSGGWYWDGKTTVKGEQNLIRTSRYVGGSGWNKSGYTVYQDYATAPDGTTTATKASPTAAGAGTSVAIGTGVSKTTDAYTWSIYAKMDSTDYPAIALYWNSSGSAHVRFDIQNGTVSATNNGNGTITGSIEDAGNGWYRCITTYSGATSSEATFYVLDSATNGDWSLNNSPDGVKGMLVWGPQLEIRDAVTGFTLTNGSTITRSQPQMQYAGQNVPRFDHDPATGESLGLLSEQSITNYITYSNSAHNWNATRGTLIANQAVAPDGTLTAAKYRENTESGEHATIKSVYIPSAGTYTVSFYVKSAGRTGIGFHIYHSNGTIQSYPTTGVPNPNVYFTIPLDGTGSVTYKPISDQQSSIEHVGNGWYRVQSTYTVTAAVTANLWIYTNNNDTSYTTHAGDNYSGFYVWGAQVEAVPFATTLIPTGSSTATRSQEVISSTGDDLADWFTDIVGDAASPGKGGSIYYEVREKGIVGSNDWQVLFYKSSTERFGSYADSLSSGGGIRIESQPDAGGAQASPNGGVRNAGSFNKVAGRFKHNDMAISLNGNAVATDTSVLLPYGITHFYLGWYTTGNMVQGHLKKFAYYPTALTDAELIALTEE